MKNELLLQLPRTRISESVRSLSKLNGVKIQISTGRAETSTDFTRSHPSYHLDFSTTAQILISLTPVAASLTALAATLIQLCKQPPANDLLASRQKFAGGYYVISGNKIIKLSEMSSPQELAQALAQLFDQTGIEKAAPTKVRILFLAANPVTTNALQLDREAREIEEKLRGTRERDKLELVTKWALRADDLQQYLLEYQPHIVHFSGHGSDTNELILEDKNGKPKPLSQAALLALFRALKDNIRLAVLNACFSQAQAIAITETIDCAIGMNKAIGDQAAITFAASLYRAIGFGRSVQTAFDLGRASLLAEGIPEDTTPVLLANARVDLSAMVLVA
jgi:hypothetical protein